MAIKIQLSATLSDALKKALRDGKNPIDRSTATEVGKIVVDGILKRIETGKSPIAGDGAFEDYINPSKYPGKRKPHSPVNLKLSGDFLDSLSSRIVGDQYGYAAQIGYSDKEGVKERGHREGVNGQPKRPTLPTAPGEDFVAEIKSRYTKAIKDRIIAVLKGKA